MIVTNDGPGLRLTDTGQVLIGSFSSQNIETTSDGHDQKVLFIFERSWKSRKRCKVFQKHIVPI
jgi:hypothetical protein